MEQGQVPDRNLAMELARVTEAASLAAGRWMGRGDKEAADQAAVDAMRLVLNSVSMEGVIVIGEGEKDEAPMLYNGEQLGAGGPPCDIAVDPIDGTTLTALGRPNAIAVIALSERGTMFDPGPCVYMEKIAVGPEAADAIELDAPVAHNLQASRSAGRPGRGAGSSRTATSPARSRPPGPRAAPTSCSGSAARPKASSPPPR